MVSQHFSTDVAHVVASIPAGKVMSYGDIAACCGRPRAARIVGGIAHFGDSELPWHRVVNRFGGLARGYPGGREAQRRHLEAEGVTIDDRYIIKDFTKYRWSPLL